MSHEKDTTYVHNCPLVCVTHMQSFSNMQTVFSSKVRYTMSQQQAHADEHVEATSCFAKSDGMDCIIRLRAGCKDGELSPPLFTPPSAAPPLSPPPLTLHVLLLTFML